MINEFMPEGELHQVEDEDWNQYDILVLEDPESDRKIMQTLESINEVLFGHLNIDWRCHKMVFIHPDSLVMNTEMIELHLDEMRMQKSCGNPEQRTKPKWEYGDTIAHNACIYKITGFYNSDKNHGYRPRDNGKICKIEGIGHDGYGSCDGGILEIEDKIFLPGNHIEFCNALIRPLIKELTNTTEYGGWLTRANKIMEFWVAMCKSESSDEVRKIIKEMEGWANREYQPILAIRREKALSTKSDALIS